MAVDPKDFLFRQGEKLALGVSIALFVGVVGLKIVGSDETLNDLVKDEENARTAIDKAVGESKSTAAKDQVEPPKIAAHTKARWERPVLAYPSESHWAFYATPDVIVEVAQPPEDQVIKGPTNLAAKASQTEVELTWGKPPAKVTMPNRDDPGTPEDESQKMGERTVAEISGYAIYRWNEDFEKTGRGGHGPENLYQVVNPPPDAAGMLQWTDTEGLEANETLYYQMSAISPITEAENGVAITMDGKTVKESVEMTSVVSVQIPDNVEITLVSVNVLNGKPTARIRVRKNVEGGWWIEEYGLLKDGDRIGKLSTPAPEGGAASTKKVDMTTKYVLQEFKSEDVPRMTSQTLYHYAFVMGGEKKDAWGSNREDIMKQFPEADMATIVEMQSTTESGFERRIVQIPMVDQATKLPSMVKKWKVLLRNTEAKPGQKAEMWIEEP